MKKIVHISISGPYTDGVSYQENYLTKYHAKMGYQVFLIASEWMYDQNGQLAKASCNDYMDENGVRVIRLPLKGKDNIQKKLRRYDGLMRYLEDIRPDIIFHHGCQSVEEATVVKYCKTHKNVRLYVDNHSDFSNSASSWLSKNIQHKMLWKYYAQMINPYVRKFYGVLPARVDFLIDMYDLPKDKVELLVMGADDECVQSAASPEVRNKIRKQYGIKKDDFLIITGGKIDLFKRQILLLMDAVNQINNPKVKLIVFGSVVDELKEQVYERCSSQVQYVGWVKTVESYEYFAASDLVVFPGRHSVFWEQVAGQGIPMVIKFWEGTTHVDCGGNVKFLKEDSVQEIIQVIEEVINVDYFKMNSMAKSVMAKFRYSYIAKRSIEIN